MDKKILDVTCGARSIWFDKHHPAAVYCDNRREQCGGKQNPVRVYHARVDPDD